MYTKIYTIPILLILLSISACNKFLEVSAPKNQLTAEAAFNNDATAQAILANIYVGCINDFGSGSFGSVTMMGIFSADEADNYSSDPGTIQAADNTLIASNGYSSNIWISCYKVIYECNSLIEGLATSTGVSAAVKKQLTGEALFLRAFAHFYACALYGKATIVTGTDYRVNTQLARSDSSDVLQFIIKDLTTAKELLPHNYSIWANERVRANKWAATALLARAYLFAGEMEKAEKEASEVIEQTGLFQLTSLDDTFLKNSEESIWQLKPIATSLNTNEGSHFILKTVPDLFALKPGFISSFEINDQRKEKWIGEYTYETNTWYYPYKYKIHTGGTPLNEYSMVLRLAEQYLIRAEARASQGKLSDAISDVDSIRKRAALPLVGNTNAAISKPDLLVLIEHERQVELFTEWAHRWIDLRRSGKIDEVLAPVKPAWESTSSLYPLPQTEINANRNIKQNPGYH